MRPLAALALIIAMPARATTDAELSDAAQTTLAAVESMIGRIDVNTRPWEDGYNPEMSHLETREARMQGWLDTVPGEDRDAPRWVAAKGQVDALAAALITWQAEAEAPEQIARMTQLGHLAYMGPGASAMPYTWYGGWQDRSVDSPSPEPKIEAWIESEHLDALAEACRTTHAQFLAVGQHLVATERCEFPANWPEVLKVAFAKELRGSIDLRVRLFESSVTDLTERGETHEYTIANIANAAGYIEEQRARYAPVVEQIDGEMPEDLFERLSVAAAAFQDAFATAKVPSAWPGGSNDSDASSALSQAVAATGLTVLATGLPNNMWTEQGAHRIRDGLVLAQGSGESWCRVYDLSATNERTATSWTAAAVSFDRTTQPFRVTACP